MTRIRLAAALEFAFAVVVAACAIARPALWRGANAARLFLLLETGCAAYLGRGLASGRERLWPAAFALGAAGVVQLWYVSAALVFSYMGEGMPDHAGLLLLMGGFALQAIVCIVSLLEWLAPGRGPFRETSSR